MKINKDTSDESINSLSLSFPSLSSLLQKIAFGYSLVYVGYSMKIPLLHYLLYL